MPAAAAPFTLHSAVGAPDDLKLSGSVRMRYENVSGQTRPGVDDDTHLYSVRTTLFAEYTRGPVRIGAEIYDSRAYGGKPGSGLTTGEVNVLEPVQAYVALDLKAPFGPGSSASVQVGRMMLNLGSRRLVAADDYRNTTQGSTGVRLDAKTAGGLTGTFIFVAPQSRRPDDQPALLNNRQAIDRESFDLVLWGGLLAKRKAIAGLDLDTGFFALDERDTPRLATRNRRLRTVSLRAMRNPAPGRFDVEVEGGYQFGSIAASTAPTAPRLDVSAYFLHADAGYQFDSAWKPRVSIEYDLASGDDGKGSYNRFDTIYGMRRADFAPGGIFQIIGRSNMSTPGVRIEVAPSPRWDGFVSYRGYWLASATDSFSTSGVRDASGRAGSYAGQGMEGRVRYWIVPNALRFEVDGAFIAKGRFLNTAPNAPRTGDTSYISLNLTTLF